MVSSPPLLDTALPGLTLHRRGKVRDVYEVDAQHLLIVATDRISAFDYVLGSGIPDKGRVLTQLSAFWFVELGDLVAHHVLATDVGDYPPALALHADRLRGRSMLVRRTEPLAIECVARGYLSGSGWKDYRATGRVCGIELPPGLRESDQLPEPIFTPATKAASGHDENITKAQAAALVGDAMLARLEDLTLKLYARGADYARARGIILADTKFEFGLLPGATVARRRRTDPDRRMHDARLVALLACRHLPARWSAGQLRQAVRARLSRIDPLEQAAARAEPARRCGRAYARQVPRRLPSPDGPGAAVTIRVQLDAVVREMVSKGILYEDACIEFERRFITCALAEEAGSIGRAAERIGMHRNTFSRKMDEYRHQEVLSQQAPPRLGTRRRSRPSSAWPVHATWPRGVPSPTAAAPA